MVYISLGSNLGDKMFNLERAIYLIDELAGAIHQKSSIYNTSPWGNVNQEDYLNQVVIISTEKSPFDLMNVLLSIENTMGRIRSFKNASRIIDLDILFFKNLIIDETELIIPHPRIQFRKFVLIPMVEIAGDLIHPVFNQTIQQLLNNCTDNLLVKKISCHEYKPE